MKIAFRNLLILVAVVAIVLPAGIFFARANMEPELCILRLFPNNSGSFQPYLLSDPDSEQLPYINCLTVHEAVWGRPRVIVMHRVTDTQFRLDGQFPDWLEDDGYLPIRMNGQRVYTNSSTVVIFAEDGSQPEKILIQNEEVPLDEPWWPDTEKLWELARTAENAELQNAR